MLMRMLLSSDLSDVVKLASPSLFKVLSARALAREVKALVASRSAVHARLVEKHRPLHPDVVVESTSTAKTPLPKSPDAAVAREVGGTILRIYFRELFAADETLLDLRPSAFGLDGGVVHWSPSPLSVTWKPAFLSGIRGLYRGFYGDDDALFRASLESLHLSSAEALFRKHFGEGDQTAVTFSTREFTRTFGAVFEAVRDAGAELDAHFLSFGFLLATLFQSLEQLGAPLDVRRAFQEATVS